VSHRLSVLFVGGTEAEVELLLRELRLAGFEPHWDRVTSMARYLAALEREPGIILACHAAELSVPRVLQLLHEQGLSVPVIVIGESSDEALIVDYIKQGAADYVHVCRPDRLGKAVQRALQEQRERDRQRQAEAQRDATLRALRTSEAKYRALVERVPAIIYINSLAEASTEFYVNSQVEKVLGFSQAEWGEGATLWLRQLHTEDRRRVLRDMALSQDSGVPFVCDYRLVARDGTVLWFHDEAVLVYDETGAPLCFQGVMLDITERVQALQSLQEERANLAERVEERTAELRAANADLARAARLKDEFLAAMSHELRTPLNAILGLSEALLEGVYGPQTEKQARSLRSIAESGRHLLDLINDILDVAKIEAGKLELQVGVVPVASVCESSMGLVKQTAMKKQIKTSVTLSDSVTQIEADARRLKQILVNLLSNAVKFTPECGQIGLEVQDDQEGEMVHFTVWDTGIGISAEDMEQLFQPFVQVDSSLSRKYNGTGLGLALVKRLANMHGGDVSVHSEVGGGSRFTVSLPRHSPADRVDAEDAEETPVPTAVIPSSRGALVLLAEDNETNTVVVRDYLESKGYRLEVARDGMEAIEGVRRMRPDVVLMDIQMPGVDGLEAIRCIREDGERRVAETPIIAVSALAMPGDDERCLEAGADAYLSKPLNLRQLVQAIETQLHAASEASHGHMATSPGRVGGRRV
jgi:PAS domain S-box-containing protein